MYQCKHCYMVYDGPNGFRPCGCKDSDLAVLPISILSMNSAPTDGTRILLKYVTFGFDSRAFKHKEDGTKWEECYWDGAYAAPQKDFSIVYGAWRVWTGNIRSEQLGCISKPLGWVPVPG